MVFISQFNSCPMHHEDRIHKWIKLEEVKACIFYFTFLISLTSERIYFWTNFKVSLFKMCTNIFRASVYIFYYLEGQISTIQTGAHLILSARNSRIPKVKQEQVWSFYHKLTARKLTARKQSTQKWQSNKKRHARQGKPHSDKDEIPVFC